MYARPVAQCIHDCWGRCRRQGAGLVEFTSGCATSQEMKATRLNLKKDFEKDAPGGAGTRGTTAPAGRPALDRPHPRCPLRVTEAQHRRAGGAAGIVWLSRHCARTRATKRQAYPDRQCGGALFLHEQGWTICLPSSTSSMSISLSAPSILKRPLFVPAAAHPGVGLAV